MPQGKILLKYIQIYGNPFLQIAGPKSSHNHPPGCDVELVYAGRSDVNSIKGRSWKVNTCWMQLQLQQKSRLEQCWSRCSKESWLIFPHLRFPRFWDRDLEQRDNFSKRKSLEMKNADRKMNSNKDRVYRSTPDKWEFESTSKPHCFWRAPQLGSLSEKKTGLCGENSQAADPPHPTPQFEKPLLSKKSWVL